jgi:hypothetical protein
MPFRIDDSFDPGTVLTRLQLPNATKDATEVAQLQNERNTASLFPIKQQMAAEQLKTEQYQNRERQLDLQETGVWQQTMQKYGGDFEKARPELAAQLRPKTLAAVDNIYLNHQDKLADIGKKKADANKITAELANEEREAFGGIAADVQKSGYNPTAMDASLSMLQQTHPEYKQHIDALRQQFGQNPDSMKQVVDSLITPKAAAAAQELESKKASQSAEEANAALRKAETRGAQAKSDIEVATANSLKSMTDADWKAAIDNTVEDQNSPLYRRTMAQVQFYRSKGDLKGASDAIKLAGEQLGKTESAVATAKATAPIKIDVAAATAGAKADMAGLTDDDYARAGEQYMRTGVMPAMGRDSMTRGKIVHAGNQWARDNGFKPQDIITMQAAYAGDKDSLKKFQAQRDQIVSFEQTAQKNLDLFLQAASKIPDTGVPWLNKPLRSLDQTVVGSENMAAVNAARQIANNEIAKVTSGGGLSGVLSDSARHEVEGYNPANATYAQTLAVAKVLKQDMANRHGSMDATLQDIKTRIGGGQPGGQQQYKKTAVGPNGHRIGTNDNGSTWYDVQTGQKVQ